MNWRQKIILFFFLCPLPTMATGEQAKPTCSWTLLRPVCKDPKNESLDLRKSPQEADGVLFNYFLVHKPRLSTSIAAFDQTTEKLQGRALKISEEVRARAIRTVTAGAHETDWTIEQRALAIRLQTVKFQTVDSTDPTCYAMKDRGVPNAAYVPTLHTVKICASLTRVHSEMIESSLAHELGHTVSPCAMSKTLYTMDQERDVSDVIRCLWPGQDDEEASGYIQSLARQVLDSNYSLHSPSQYPDSEGTRLIHCGILKPARNAEARTLVAHRKFIECATRNHLASYNDWLAQSLLMYAKMPKGLSPAQKRIIEKGKSETPTLCYSKTDETFADAFAGQVLDRAVKEKNLSAKSIAQHAHDFSMIACRGKLEPGYDFTPELYPSAAERTRLLIETENSILKLGCQPDPVALCSLDATTFSVESEKETPTRTRGVSH